MKPLVSLSSNGRELRWVSPGTHLYDKDTDFGISKDIKVFEQRLSLVSFPR